MIYSFLVLASPTHGQTAATASQFALAALARGHSIHSVFFLNDGVAAGSANVIYPQDESTPVAQWAGLAEKHGIELNLCISSALRRGIMDEAESQRYERSASTMHPAFTIAGLGQLVQASASSDRLMTFGA